MREEGGESGEGGGGDGSGEICVPLTLQTQIRGRIERLVMSSGPSPQMWPSMGAPRGVKPCVS